MNKSIYFVSFSCIILFLFYAIFPFEAFTEDKKVIHIAGDKNFPPFEYLSDNGVYSGFNVDVINAMSIQTGISIEYHPMPWDQAIKALHDGRVDAIQGMKYSPERDRIYDFSIPYFTSSQAIFVLKDNMYIREIKDLKDRKVVVQKGDIANALLSKVDHVQLIKTESQEEAIQLLIEGKADAFVGNYITGQYFIQKSKKQSLIKIVGKPLDPADYGMVVLPKNKQLLTLFNEGISKIKKDGTYEKIEKKWFGEYVLPIDSNHERVLFYLKIGMIIFIFLSLVVLWWNRILKKEVARRTKQIASMNRKLEEKMMQLKENVHFQQQLLDSAYSFFVTLDQQAKISMMNSKAMQYLQLENTILGMPYKDTMIANFIPEAEIKQTLQNNQVFLQKETVWEKSFSFREKEKRIISYSIYPITTSSGDSAGAVLNFTDITDKRELERKMAEANRLRALGQLMMGIAHEIRNPLMAILTYTQLLPKKMNNPEFCKFFSQHVSGEITRLNNLVDDLLNYARPKKSSPIQFSIFKMIQSVLQLFKQKMKEKKIQVSVEVQDNLYVVADRHQMQQVLMNIILNAIQALSENGELIIRGFERDDHVIIEVEDNGCGISEEDIHKILEPFYSNKPNGVGLGLSISYQLIKENNGFIDVKSVKDQGTVIAVHLPCVKERMT